MRKLGEQWIEEVDGVQHMVKAVVAIEEGKSQSLPGFGFQDLHQEVEDMFAELDEELGRPATKQEKIDAYGNYMAYQNNRNGKV